jgi:hypothetical protein
VYPLSLLREKVERLTASRAYTGLLAVMKQLDIAARHFQHGRADGQDYLHTDALLRLDRALLGALNEVYGLAGGGDPTEAATGDIERFVLEGAGLPERSVALLGHHLRQWRPLLERDLQFAASEQDAYLAFLSALSVVGVLLDDLTRLEAYTSEKRRAVEREEQRVQGGPDEIADGSNGEQALDVRIRNLLQVYVRTFTDPEGAPPTDDQLRGRLRGFLETVLPATSLMPEPPLRSPSGVLRPSFIIAEGDESVVLEVKRAASTTSASERSFVTEQMMMFLLTSGITSGIIALLPDAGGTFERSEASFGLDGRRHVITTLRPQGD